MVFKEIWAIAERSISVNKAIDDHYHKLNNMLFEALKNMLPENCWDRKVDHAVASLLPFIEGDCITTPNIKLSTKRLAE